MNDEKISKSEAENMILKSKEEFYEKIFEKIDDIKEELSIMRKDFVSYVSGERAKQKMFWKIVGSFGGIGTITVFIFFLFKELQ